MACVDGVRRWRRWRRWRGGSLLLQLLTDWLVAAKIADYCQRSVALIQKGDMSGAFNVWDQMLNGDIWPYGDRTRE